MAQTQGEVLLFVTGELEPGGKIELPEVFCELQLFCKTCLQGLNVELAALAKLHMLDEAGQPVVLHGAGRAFEVLLVRVHLGAKLESLPRDRAPCKAQVS